MPGSAVLRDARDTSSYEHVGGNAYASFIVQLTPDAIDGDAPPLFQERVLRLDALRNCIVRAAACRDDEEFESRIFDIFDLASHYSFGGRGRPHAASLRVQRMKRLIEQRCYEKITLSGLAESVRINPFTCVRQFKAAFGETPFAYITRCRIDRAKVLLNTSALTIDEVARESGFASHTYFCRMFKKLTGLSPRDFRHREQRS